MEEYKMNKYVIYVIFIVIMFFSIRFFIWWIRDKEYKKAKKEIFNYVKLYKRRCTGVNVFPVTVYILQNIFREYDTETIEKVHKDLVKENVIRWDMIYSDWCIK